MKVVYENILVELPAEESKMSGVYIPEEDRKVKRVGKVIAQGESIPESVKTALDSHPNIEYKEYYDGAEITIEGRKYIVMNFKDILIIL